MKYGTQPDRRKRPSEGGLQVPSLEVGSISNKSPSSKTGASWRGEGRGTMAPPVFSISSDFRRY